MTDRERPAVFWDYADLFLFISFVGGSLFLVLILVALFGRLVPFGRPFLELAGQMVWYVLLFSALALLLRVRYDAPFWKSLGWRFPFHGAVTALLAGPFLVLSLGLIGYIIRAPVIRQPFEEMLNNRPTIVLFGLVAVVLGPVSEELAFRGFLLPLVMRSIGVAAGIVLTGVLFGALHAYEYDWSWRHSLLIALAGIVFGWVRYAARSTAASTFMHATFNLTQFVALMVQSGRTW